MTTDTDKPGAEAPAEDARSRAWDELEDGKTASAELKDDEAPPADAAGAEGDPDGSTPDGGPKDPMIHRALTFQVEAGVANERSSCRRREHAARGQ